MAKAKTNPVEAADAMSEEDNKQMAEMRAADKEPEDADSTSADNTGSQSAADKKVADSAADKAGNDDNAAGKDADKNKNTMVPHAALEEERQRRKAAEKAREEQAISQARLEERLTLINQAMEANNKKPSEKPQKMEVPDPEKDALGALKALQHNIRLTEEENKILIAAREETTQERHRAQEVAAITQNAAAQEKEFVAITPDYWDASNHLVNSRMSELMLYGATEQQARVQISQETLALAAQAQHLKKNPAQMVYEFAKARGYQPKAAAAAQTEAEKITALAAAQKENRSLSDVQGNAPPAGKLTAKDLATMSETQFSKVLAGLSAEEQKALMGD